MRMEMHVDSVVIRVGDKQSPTTQGGYHDRSAMAASRPYRAATAEWGASDLEFAESAHLGGRRARARTRRLVASQACARTADLLELTLALASLRRIALLARRRHTPLDRNARLVRQPSLRGRPRPRLMISYTVSPSCASSSAVVVVAVASAADPLPSSSGCESGRALKSGDRLCERRFGLRIMLIVIASDDAARLLLSLSTPGVLPRDPLDAPETHTPSCRPHRPWWPWSKVSRFTTAVRRRRVHDEGDVARHRRMWSGSGVGAANVDRSAAFADASPGMTPPAALLRLPPRQ